MYITVRVSLSLHFRKFIESNQLCYIYLASYAGPVDLFSRSLYLGPGVLHQNKLQIVLYKNWFHVFKLLACQMFYRDFSPLVKMVDPLGHWNCYLIIIEMRHYKTYDGKSY